MYFSNEQSINIDFYFKQDEDREQGADCDVKTEISPWNRPSGNIIKTFCILSYPDPSQELGYIDAFAKELQPLLSNVTEAVEEVGKVVVANLTKPLSKILKHRSHHHDIHEHNDDAHDDDHDHEERHKDDEEDEDKDEDEEGNDLDQQRRVIVDKINNCVASFKSIRNPFSRDGFRSIAIWVRSNLRQEFLPCAVVMEELSDDHKTYAKAEDKINVCDRRWVGSRYHMSILTYPGFLS